MRRVICTSLVTKNVILRLQHDDTFIDFNVDIVQSFYIILWITRINASENLQFSLILDLSPIAYPYIL